MNTFLSLLADPVYGSIIGSLAGLVIGSIVVIYVMIPYFERKWERESLEYNPPRVWEDPWVKDMLDAEAKAIAYQKVWEESHPEWVARRKARYEEALERASNEKG